MASSRALTVGARLLVPAILLLLVWTLADAEDALARLGSVQWEWLVLAFVAANAQIVLSATRWMLVARRLGLSLSWRYAVAEYYLAQLVNQTVPGGVGGGRRARGALAAGGGPARARPRQS